MLFFDTTDNIAKGSSRYVIIIHRSIRFISSITHIFGIVSHMRTGRGKCCQSKYGTHFFRRSYRARFLRLYKLRTFAVNIKSLGNCAHKSIGGNIKSDAVKDSVQRVQCKLPGLCGQHTGTLVIAIWQFREHL